MPNPSSNYQQYDPLIPKEATSGALAGLIGYGLQESGLTDYLNDLGSPALTNTMTDMGLNTKNMPGGYERPSHHNSTSDFGVSKTSQNNYMSPGGSAVAVASGVPGMGPVVPPTSQYSSGGIGAPLKKLLSSDSGAG